jgi:hypothetical protein
MHNRRAQLGPSQHRHQPEQRMSIPQRNKTNSGNPTSIPKNSLTPQHRRITNKNASLYLMNHQRESDNELHAGRRRTRTKKHKNDKETNCQQLLRTGIRENIPRRQPPPSHTDEHKKKPHAKKTNDIGNNTNTRRIHTQPSHKHRRLSAPTGNAINIPKSTKQRNTNILILRCTPIEHKINPPRQTTKQRKTQNQKEGSTSNGRQGITE